MIDDLYHCPRCEAGESTIGSTFRWHGYTPQEGYKNAEQCFDGFTRAVVEILLDDYYEFDCPFCYKEDDEDGLEWDDEY